jgi:hypothetical protein
MSMLLDTHVLLWFLGASERLRPQALRKIQAANEVVFVSAVSVWEIEIKRARQAQRAQRYRGANARTIRMHSGVPGAYATGLKVCLS